MKKTLASAILALAIVLPAAPAWAGKNCPKGSHKGPGPDESMIYCYDNDTNELVKVISK